MLIGAALARSIPARAGEPTWTHDRPDTRRVYPRPCGGALLLDCDGELRRGLSPPVRGSPRRSGRSGLPRGSIPARAGEPYPPIPAPSATPVYPRPCGGAAHEHIQRQKSAGLSPPVRGSHLPQPRLVRLPRSIPARAGEPDCARLHLNIYEVYPRPCGGAVIRGKLQVVYRGLSPPVRGSRIAPACTSTSTRSIPARAGEPSSVGSFRSSTAVYPRPCGGATIPPASHIRCVGLSPPVRGSRFGEPPPIVA